MIDFEENINLYIDQYDIEKYLFLKGSEWRKRGWLKKPEFMDICLWKSRRPKNLYEQNKPEKIKECTKKVFTEQNERNKIELLTNLKGVGIPTASAILCITNPEEYPVIDVRCIETLIDLKLIAWNTINLNNWIEYLAIVRELANRHSKTAREIEKGLFAFNRIKLDIQNKNLY